MNEKLYFIIQGILIVQLMIVTCYLLSVYDASFFFSTISFQSGVLFSEYFITIFLMVSTEYFRRESMRRELLSKKQLTVEDYKSLNEKYLLLYGEIEGLESQWDDYLEIFQNMLRNNNFKMKSNYYDELKCYFDKVLRNDNGIMGSDFKMMISNILIRFLVYQNVNDVLVVIRPKHKNLSLSNELIKLIMITMKDSLKKLSETSKLNLVLINSNGIKQSNVEDARIFHCPKCHAPLPELDMEIKMLFCPYCDFDLYSYQGEL